MNFKVEKFIPDKQGRFIILKLSLEEKVVVVVNIYAPNDVAQQVSFFKRLNQQLEEFAQDTIVIVETSFAHSLQMIKEAESLYLKGQLSSKKLTSFVICITLMINGES